ncbi:MAG TPA: phenylalanine--tRNA ligase subunit beta [Fibrobacteria bacterium]|nr:phenylalanine--tRNA ligase subunit beta [Fibrobacteria bacterium]
MEVSLNWIKKYVDLSGSTDGVPDDDPRALSKALTSLGLEVEGMRILGGLPGVVSAEVLECGRHPEADKLSVCKVTDGAETYPVVCGAPNVAKGQKVLLAKVGAELPGRTPGEPGLKIKKAKLRGQESHGMICAEDEVGLGNGHDGILVLDPSTPAGLPMDRIPGLGDVVYEINVTPNRPDALNHVGVARELAAIKGKPLRYPVSSLREEGPAVSGLAGVELDDTVGCTRYVGRVIQGVKVGPSPDWLVKALKSIGKRSINNVVDLTNYVLLELGQPSHAFDLGRIRGRKVVVRKGRDGEKLTTLDGVERAITAEDMLIADAEGPMVLAGVMGGKDSEVSDSTADIFLEVACFNPSVVRRQGRRHGLSSDSSYRFERGVDPLNTAWVSDYLAGLIAETCGGKVAEGRLEKASPEHPQAPRIVYVRPSRAEKLLGAAIGEGECVRRLESIGLRLREAAQVHGEEALAFAVPGFRGDLEREADLIEEIARLGDYNNIPVILPSLPLGYKALPAPESLARKLRHHLRDAGLNETLNLRFSSRKALAKLGLAPEDPRGVFVPLRNPLSEEWEILPTTALPALLHAAAYNQNNQERNIRFFEIAKSFYHLPGERSERTPGVMEEEMLYLVLAGDWTDRRPWGADASVAGPVEFHHLKGLLENLLAAAGIEARFAFPGTEPYLHPVESGGILADLAPAVPGSEVLYGRRRVPGQKAAPRPADRIGGFGVLHPRTQSRFDLKGPVLVAEISLSGLLAAFPRDKKFSPFGHFSAVSRDLNLVVDDSRTHGDILSRMPVGRIPILQEVRLNSVYRGTGVPAGKKALHYSFIYRHAEKTLTDEEVNKAQEKLNQELGKDSGIVFK